MHAFLRKANGVRLQECWSTVAWVSNLPSSLVSYVLSKKTKKWEHFLIFGLSKNVGAFR